MGGVSGSDSTIGVFGSAGATNISVLDAPAGFLASNPYFTVADAPQNGHTAAGTDPEFSLYMRDGSDFLIGLDPRPAAGSPLLPANGASIGEGAPKAADYQGAFGPGDADLWLANWTWFAGQGFLQGVQPGESVVITAIGAVDADTIFIEFLSSVASTEHTVMSSSDLSVSPFANAVTISGGSLTTDASGAGRIEVDLTADALFFQIQIP